MSEYRHPAPYGLDVTLFVTFYRRPDGRQTTSAITKVDPEEIKFFNENQILVGMEDCGSFYAMYGMKEGFEYDVTHICKVDADCAAELKKLRRNCEEHIANGGWVDESDA